MGRRCVAPGTGERELRQPAPSAPQPRAALRGRALGAAAALPVSAAPSSGPAAGGDGTGAGRAGARRSAAEGGGARRREAWGPRDMTAGRQAEGADPDPASARLPSRVAKLLSALFYGTCSFLIVLVNKALLTTYR